MNKLAKYKELVRLIEQMINDKVHLVHGGQIIEWHDTQILNTIREIKKGSTSSDKYANLPSNDN
ncbi:MAG: hypothetical protein U5L45_04815 [Saprospiraceae bacterium]|nr:hypothetical protein [Saprospiraceae bacterium]